MKTLSKIFMILALIPAIILYGIGAICFYLVAFIARADDWIDKKLR